MAMQHGRISYAKVRAITRVATADNERSLLDLALAGNCAHVERFVRAWRRVDRVQAAHEAETKHLHRQLSTWVDDDGMVVIRGRLTPEVGAVVQRALEAAADRLFRETSGASTGNAMAEELTPAQRRADALALLAESALAADFDGGTAGDRYQVVLHVTADDAADTRVESTTPPASAATLDGAIEVDHGGCTFPWKRRSASRATPRWCTCATAPSATSSTWAARRARFRHPSAARLPRAIPVAASRAAHLADATLITCITPPQRAHHARRGPRLVRWWRHAPRQPRAPVPTPPPRRPRRRIRRHSWARRRADLPPARWRALAGRPCCSARPARAAGRDAARDREAADLGRHALRSAVGDQCALPRPSRAEESRSEEGRRLWKLVGALPV